MSVLTPCGLTPFRIWRYAGTWYEAGYHMATTIATPAAYSPIPFAFASLTWGGGLSTLIVGIAVTWCVRKPAIC